MSDHAQLSPSGAHRWMRCPGSVDMERGLPDTSSEFADEGSTAHALADNCLSKGIDTLHNEALDGIPEHLLKYVDEDMQDYVQAYVDRVREIRDSLIDPVLMSEKRLPITDYVPDSWGTSDAIVIGEVNNVVRLRRGYVIDLKYGRGVRVDADENEQLMLYALGADQAYGFIHDVERWVVVVLQPRLNSESQFEITAVALREWGLNRVVPAAQAATSGKGELVPGDKQCQWCKAKAICPARAKQALSIAQQEFDVIDLDSGDRITTVVPCPQALTPAQIAEVLPRLGALESWANAVKAHALGQALSGVEIPGYKLVEGQTKRTWRDTTAAEALLFQQGIAKSLCYKPGPFIGIGEAEKLLKTINKPPAVLNEVLHKPRGAPNLVPVTDPRQPFSQPTAADDFAITNDPWSE